MSYKIKNEEIGKELKKMETSEGYLILLTRLNDGTLTHFWATQNFQRGDFLPSLAHHRNTLKGEMPPTTINEPKVEEGEKQLPPEYRDKNK